MCRHRRKRRIIGLRLAGVSLRLRCVALRLRGIALYLARVALWLNWIALRLRCVTLWLASVATIPRAHDIYLTFFGGVPLCCLSCSEKYEVVAELLGYPNAHVGTCLLERKTQKSASLHSLVMVAVAIERLSIDFVLVSEFRQILCPQSRVPYRCQIGCAGKLRWQQANVRAPTCGFLCLPRLSWLCVEV